MKLGRAVLIMTGGATMTNTEKDIRAGDYSVGYNGVAVIYNTFGTDFTIAERIGGAEAVRDTYKRALDGWKDDIRYMTALCITLNHKIFQHYKNDEPLARVYDKLWKECDAYILACEHAGTLKEKYINFNEDEISYFLQATD